MILSVPAVAVRKAKPRHYTLEQVDSAANLLVTVADGDKPGVCGILPAEAKRLLMAVHPRLDELRQARVSLLLAHRPKGPFADPRWEKNCASGCHCGLYADILDAIGDEHLNASDRKSRDQLMALAKSLSPSERLACARKTAWFCKSSLHSQLKKEAKDYPEP
jgi:hypothetical protein